MTTPFGQSPYRACWYGDARNDRTLSELPPQASDDVVLRFTLESLKCGEFSAVGTLTPYLSHHSYDLRQYAHQLYAHVCNHDQVEQFAKAIPYISEPAEFHRFIVRLGETLSGNALPILKSLNDTYGDDDEICEHIVLSLRLLGRMAGVAEPTRAARASINEVIEILQQEIVRPCYFYRGVPVFIGDVAKELVSAALVANRENRNIVLVRQHWILSTFSGVLCPIQNGQVITNADLNAVFTYVEGVAKNEWKRGAKYFYGHAI